MKNNITGLLLIIIIFQILVQTLTSCANIIPPTGGLRDTLPPVLVKAEPKDSTLNFKSNKIILTFNEYVLLDNTVQQTMIMSPNPDNVPYAKGLLQNVTIRLKDSLKPNTTYSIDFGNAIKDVNEGNTYKNFTYVFSTGSTIATGELSGQVQLAETGKHDSTLIVILQNNLTDSAIKKIKPYYYTRLDSSGHFHFRFLENGTYNVFVLPNDYTKKYDDSTKMFAFLNDPVTISDSITPQQLMLYAYNQYPPGKEQNNTASTTNTSTKKKTDTTTTIKLATNLERGQQDLLGNLIISFQKPIAHYDSSKISFSDTNYKAVSGYTITQDTSHKNFILQYPWKEDEYFRLVVQKDAFADSSGRMLAKNDTLRIKTTSESEYGSIRLNFTNLDLNRNAVLQFVQNDKIVDSVAMQQTLFYRKLYKPGEYELRILYDADKNMTWTQGDYALKKQPEIVVRVTRKITIKSNWDNEVNVNL